MTYDDCAISVEGLSYTYGNKRALDDVNFCCKRGEFCALLGLNGAGKSTLIAIMTRLLVPSAGRVVIAGHNLRQQPRSALAELGIVFQQSTLDPDLTVRHNLNYFAALHGLHGTHARNRIDAALARLEVEDRADEVVRKLNGGHRRRVEIARSLVHRPSILILDEPTVGLDASARAKITDHVHDLAADSGLTVIWTTHLVDEIRPEDDVIVLHQGRVLAHERAKNLAERAPLSESFLAMTREET